MEDKPDNDLFLQASGLRSWFLCGVLSSLPVVVLCWFRNDLSDGILFAIGWNIGFLVRTLFMGNRRYDITLGNGSIQGPVTMSLLEPYRSTAIDLEQIDFGRSGRYWIVDHRLRLRNGAGDI
jgi:hypothetical protein